MARSCGWCVGTGKARGGNVSGHVGADNMGEGSHQTVIKQGYCSMCDNFWAVLVGCLAGSALVMSLLEMFSGGRLDCSGLIMSLF